MWIFFVFLSTGFANIELRDEIIKNIYVYISFMLFIRTQKKRTNNRRTMLIKYPFVDY